MRTYFDTNVYKFIAQTAEATQVRRLLDANGCVLEASSANLTELIRAPVQQERLKGLETLFSLSSSPREIPEGYEWASEFVAELRRCRPEALRPHPNTQSIEQMLRRHRRFWAEVRRFPALLPKGIDLELQEIESGIGLLRKGQLQLHRNHPSRSILSDVGAADPEVAYVAYGIDITEQFWRRESMQAWYSMAFKAPGLGARAAWVTPYLSTSLTELRHMEHFWFIEVESANMPRHRIDALSSYYQSYRKPESGNHYDALNAHHALNNDVFVTADKRFYKVLVSLAEHFESIAIPVLIKRAAPSAAEQIAAALDYAIRASRPLE